MFSWKPQGNANEYAILKDGNWFAALLLNGEMLATTQEIYIATMTEALNNMPKH